MTETKFKVGDIVNYWYGSYGVGLIVSAKYHDGGSSLLSFEGYEVVSIEDIRNKANLETLRKNPREFAMKMLGSDIQSINKDYGCNKPLYPLGIDVIGPIDGTLKDCVVSEIRGILGNTVTVEYKYLIDSGVITAWSNVSQFNADCYPGDWLYTSEGFYRIYKTNKSKFTIDTLSPCSQSKYNICTNRDYLFHNYEPVRLTQDFPTRNFGDVVRHKGEDWIIRRIRVAVHHNLYGQKNISLEYQIHPPNITAKQVMREYSEWIKEPAFPQLCELQKLSPSLAGFPAPKYKIGDAVNTRSGRGGYIEDVWPTPDGARYKINGKIAFESLVVGKMENVIQETEAYKINSRESFGPLGDTKSDAQKRINSQIEALVAKKGTKRSKYTADEIELLKQYSGNDVLHDYYTPDIFCKHITEIAKYWGYKDGGKILEPSIGTGNMIKYFDPCNKVLGYEYNQTSATIAEVLYPNVKVVNNYFETMFLQEPHYRTLKKPAPGETFDLVVGNPPYGAHKKSQSSLYYANFAKLKIEQIEQFFLWKSIEVLKPGGILIFVMPVNFLQNSQKYNEIKRKILKICYICDAFRMPSLFASTTQATDILVLKKRS